MPGYQQLMQCSSSAENARGVLRESASICTVEKQQKGRRANLLANHTSDARRE
jgi:hypothetical protein